MEIRGNVTQDQMISFTSEHKVNQVEATSELESKLKEDNSKEEKNTIQNQDIVNVIEKINNEFEIKDNELSFSVHEKTKQIMIKVLDKETKEVIKEIPSEKIVDMVASMMEVAGLIIDKRG